MSIDAGIELQPRDLDTFEGLYDSRIMTLRHISAIHFDGQDESAKKRIQKLKAAGFIQERKRNVNEPSILSLTKRGFEALRDHGRFDDSITASLPSLVKRTQVSELTLRHELSVLDVKAALVGGASQIPNLSVDEFSTWPALYEFTSWHPITRKEVLVKPDGFLRLGWREGAGKPNLEAAFFLEVDRSTETIERLIDRCVCYTSFYKSGGFAVRLGHDASTYRSFPFRVLIVAKTEERRDNLANALVTNNPPIFTQVWLSTQADVMQEPFGKIWVCPRDYRGTSAQIPTFSIFEN